MPLIRPMIQEIKNRRKKALIGAEIGVATGSNALTMLENLDMEKLYLIDPYSNKPERIQEAIGMVKDYKDKVEFVVRKSSEAVKDMPDQLDFVYIDGDHSYQAVKEDIENYFKKVKRGGIIGGHDFSKDLPDIVRAVEEFVKAKKLKFINKEVDWWITK